IELGKLEYAWMVQPILRLLATVADVIPGLDKVAQSIKEFKPPDLDAGLDAAIKGAEKLAETLGKGADEVARLGQQLRDANFGAGIDAWFKKLHERMAADAAIKQFMYILSLLNGGAAGGPNVGGLPRKPVSVPPIEVKLTPSAEFGSQAAAQAIAKNQSQMVNPLQKNNALLGEVLAVQKQIRDAIRERRINDRNVQPLNLGGGGGLA